MHFVLPKGSKVIHIGGWKKLESEKISKEEFNTLAAELFGIDKTDIIDIYGFTEQMGLNYPDCPCGCKHAPLYSEVIVRDIINKEVLPDGGEPLIISFNQDGLIIDPGLLRHIVYPVALSVIANQKRRIRIMQPTLR